MDVEPQGGAGRREVGPASRAGPRVAKPGSVSRCRSARGTYVTDEVPRWPTTLRRNPPRVGTSPGKASRTAPSHGTTFSRCCAQAKSPRPTSYGARGWRTGCRWDRWPALSRPRRRRRCRPAHRLLLRLTLLRRRDPLLPGPPRLPANGAVRPDRAAFWRRSSSRRSWWPVPWAGRCTPCRGRTGRTLRWTCLSETLRVSERRDHVQRRGHVPRRDHILRPPCKRRRPQRPRNYQDCHQRQKVHCPPQLLPNQAFRHRPT